MVGKRTPKHSSNTVDTTTNPVSLIDESDTPIFTRYREYEDLHMLIMDLRIWLELEIPTINDGDMFGQSPLLMLPQ